MDIALGIAGIVFAILSILPAFPLKHWIYRLWDFPRVQLCVAQILIIILWAIFVTEIYNWWIVAILVNGIIAIYNFNKFRHHTFLARKETEKCSVADDRKISIISANVLQTNTNYQGFIDIINNVKPDVFLAMETNHEWQKHMDTLESEYPYSVKCPLENLYGMHLYSKLELTETDLRYMVEEGIPSIRTEIKLPCGEKIQLFCAHPEPPSPTEAETSKERDFELMLIAREIVKCDLPALIIGDFNDVTWSRNVKRFKRVTKLEDPRIGRGFFSTYNAKHKLLRFPIDHIYHSDHFGLGSLHRLPYYGSDHFAMNYKLCLKEN